jgi:DNA-binding transcriptional ArsR family regulator
MDDQFSQLAALIGDPVRAKILWVLMDKRAYTATELAIYADTTPQNISMHLTKLINADLLKAESQGRHKYYTFARPEVPYAVEAIAGLLPKQESKQLASTDGEPIRFCRSCYDHLAGKVGVLVNEGLIKKRYLFENGDDYGVSADGKRWFVGLGINIDELKQQKRRFAKPCLDWSERRPHLAGALGAALLTKLLEEGWLRRINGNRILTLTGKGGQALFETLGIEVYQTA